MEDSESTKYTAKLFLNRKNFYAANSAATMRKSNSQSDNGPRSTEPQVIIEKLKKYRIILYLAWETAYASKRSKIAYSRVWAGSNDGPE